MFRYQTRTLKSDADTTVLLSLLIILCESGVLKFKVHNVLTFTSTCNLIYMSAYLFREDTDMT